MFPLPSAPTPPVCRLRALLLFPMGARHVHRVAGDARALQEQLLGARLWQSKMGLQQQQQQQQHEKRGGTSKAGGSSAGVGAAKAAGPANVRASPGRDPACTSSSGTARHSTMSFRWPSGATVGFVAAGETGGVRPGEATSRLPLPAACKLQLLPCMPACGCLCGHAPRCEAPGTCHQRP